MRVVQRCMSSSSRRRRELEDDDPVGRCGDGAWGRGGGLLGWEVDVDGVVELVVLRSFAVAG